MHTKGEWKVEKEERGLIHIKDDFGHHITTVYAGGTKNLKANAQLISAAPDLLEVCKSVRSAILFGGNIDWDIELDKLQQAIEKAGGQ